MNFVLVYALSSLIQSNPAPIHFILISEDYNQFLQYCYGCMGHMNKSRLDMCCKHSKSFCCLIKFNDRQRQLCCSFIKQMQYKTQPLEVLASFILIVVFIFSIFMCLENNNEINPRFWTCCLIYLFSHINRRNVDNLFVSLCAGYT